MSWFEILDVLFAHGDILSFDTDAIVCTINVDYEAYGKISQKIYDQCHPELIYKIRKLKGVDAGNKLKLGQAITLNCQNEWDLNFQKIILVAMWDFHSEYTWNLFYMGYINSIRQANENNLETIAMPIMAYEGKIDLVARTILKVLTDLDRLKNSSEFSLEEIFFISYNQEHVETLDQLVGQKIF